jgi:hypothetical protein
MVHHLRLVSLDCLNNSTAREYVQDDISQIGSREPLNGETAKFRDQARFTHLSEWSISFGENQYPRSPRHSTYPFRGSQQTTGIADRGF